MKILPCENCKGRTLGFLPYAPARFRDGDPYTLLAWPATLQAVLGYTCAACKRRTEITANVFNMLPTLTLAHLREAKVAGIVEHDLAGAGITGSQLDQLEEGGVSVAEMVANR